MKNITSISIQKGGPGKTTVCRNLGQEISETKRKVLLVDNDPQGNLTKAIFGDDLPDSIMKVSGSVTSSSSKVSPGVSNSYWLYEKHEIPEPLKINDTLSIIGATKHLAEMGTRSVDSVYEFVEKLKFIAEEFDDVFIDCPPAAGTLQTAAHGASKFLIIPTNLDEDSIDGLKEQISSAAANKHRLNPDLTVLGIVINGKDSHKINIEEILHNSLKEEYGNLIFDTVITHSVKVTEARSFNQSVRQYSPKSIQGAQFLALSKEYLTRIAR